MIRDCDPSTTPAGQHCEHSTGFKYSRFDKKEAGPRNVAALSGKKAKRTAATRAGGAKALPEDL